MQVSIKYFASLRELIGESRTTMDIEPNSTVEELWAHIIQSREIDFDNVMMAVNTEYVKPEHKLQEGDEVAFFPPVTGG